MSEANAPEAVDQIVSGTILTMDGARRVIADGAVAIRDGTIVAVGPAVEIDAAYTAPVRRGGPDAIVLPGFLDCHTHATQALLRGLIAGELPMIYRLYLPADMALSPEEAHVAAKLCAAQLARSGVTLVCDFETNVSDDPKKRCSPRCARSASAATSFAAVATRRCTTPRSMRRSATARGGASASARRRRTLPGPRT